MNSRLSFITAAGLLFALAPTAAIAAPPNDPFYPLSWHHQTIGSESAWQISPGSRDVVVAVIDSGIDPNHPDLAGQLVSGWNLTNSSTNTSPIGSHGTSV